MIAFCSLSVLSCSQSTSTTSTVQTNATPPVTSASHIADPGFHLLFDGVSTKNWQMSTIKNQLQNDPGHFVVENGALKAITGNSLGLYWCTTPTPANFILKIEWATSRPNDNSGVFIRFPSPEKAGNNTAQTAIDQGFEVQIDQAGRPDGAAKHKTGAIYNLAGPENADKLPLHPPGQWNLFEIRVQNQNYTISLNGQQITQFHFQIGSDSQHADRGLPSTSSAPRFIGLQTHPGAGPVYFRTIQIKNLDS